MRGVAHYCQKCLAANPLGQELCGQCGTRLMLIVEPPAMRYDAASLNESYEEHLLERISALENSLLRMVHRLEQGLDLLMRQARNSYLDHTLIETLIGVLSEAGAIDVDQLDALWRERCQRDAAEQDESLRREELRADILARYQGTERETFAQIIDEGFALLGRGQAAKGIRLLERAAALAPGNARLLTFLGEHFFRADKMMLARDYLSRAFQVAPDDYAVCLLLGLVCGDDGESELAKGLLGNATRQGSACFAAHYGLGRLLAAEHNWPDALAEFKRALVARPSPEAHYVVGCVYYQLGRDRLASHHLRKAIEMDEEYAAAFYMLGLVYLRSGEPQRAQEAFRTARELGGNEPPYRMPAQRRSRPKEMLLISPLFNPTGRSRKRLVTGGDRRLADVVREDALNAAAGHYSQR